MNSERFETVKQRLGMQFARERPGGQPYARVRAVDGVVYVSAHAGYMNGQLVYPGVAGEGVTLEQARQSAAVAALNCLESVQELIGLDRVAEVVQMTGHIACVRNYDGLRDVMHEASAIVNEVFAVTGRHARTTLGAYALPQGASVVVEMVLQLH